MLENGVFFIDRNGNRISIDDIESHIGLANEIMERDQKLKSEFNESGMKDPSDFFVSKKGYLKITCQGFYRKCICSHLLITPIQNKFIEKYIAEGYDIEDMDFHRFMENEER